LASLDVTSLFTNVPIDRALESIEIRWGSISKNTSIPLIDFKMAVEFVLSSTYFIFNNKCYKQIFGTPMGSPLSPVIADLVLQDLEKSAIELLPFRLPFYYRYVDDIILTAPSDSFDQILHAFNAQYNRLQFTIEIERDKRISFLDLIFINENGKLIFDIFHKPTFSGRYLSYYSHHPIIHKKGTIFGMTDKIISLSHPKYHQKNFTETINLLLKNGYPIEFIFSNIRNRIKTLVSKSQNTPIIPHTSDNPPKKYFTVPYIKHISNSFTSISVKFGYPMAFTILNTLSTFIKTGKDKIEGSNRCNVVYRIDCKDCDACYVGQTKRRLITRANEHKNDINKKSGTLSVISTHRLQGHDFDWNSVRILDNESAWYRRIISEMIYIKTHSNSLNKQSDTEMLSDSYNLILHKLNS